MPPTPHSEWAKQVGPHCSTCGHPWSVLRRESTCVNCRAGLPCRADTTDSVAPDDPCMGFTLAGGIGGTGNEC
jgi:hypothetical protein